MEERLAELIYSYRKNNKSVDRNFVKVAFYIIIDNYKLNGIRLKNLTYNSKECGSYNNQDNIIKIYRSSIKKLFYRVVKEYLDQDITLDTGEYIMTVETILHEFEHANQKICLQYENTAEGIILKDTVGVFEHLKEILEKENDIKEIKLLIENFSKKKKTLYEYSPRERLANIHASDISHNIAKLLSDDNTVIFFKSKYYHCLLSGYNVGLINDKSDCPTKHYLEEFNALDNWVLIEELSRNLSSLERIKLGLKDNDDTLKQIAEKSYKLSFEKQ